MGEMRASLHLNERLFALYYPHVCARAENAGQRETRRALLAQATGRTLEFGAGSGVNLTLYPDSVTELVVSEPSPYMRAHLRSALARGPLALANSRLQPWSVENLPCAEQSFDTVVGTFVLCSVDEQALALREIARVLVPGGRYLFLEHVRAPDGTALGRVQDLIDAPHAYLAAGCHPNRDTARAIRDSPLELQQLQRGSQPRSLPSVRPTIRGVAVRRR